MRKSVSVAFVACVATIGRLADAGALRNRANGPHTFDESDRVRMGSSRYSGVAQDKRASHYQEENPWQVASHSC